MFCLQYNNLHYATIYTDPEKIIVSMESVHNNNSANLDDEIHLQLPSPGELPSPGGLLMLTDNHYRMASVKCELNVFFWTTLT